MMEQQFIRLSMFNIKKILLNDMSRSASGAKATVRYLRAEEESLHICTLVI